MGTADKLRQKSWLLLALLSCAQFVLVVDMTIVTVSLPSISHQLHFSQANIQWIITFYGLTFGGFLMIGGRSGDLFGRRKMFLAGLACFMTMSILCALAQNQAELIIGRAGQGLGAALASPSALSFLTMTFPDGAARNRALGVWSAVGASGATAGNVIGGVITSGPGWRFIFLVNVPICIVVIVMSLVVLPATPRRERQPLDLSGALFVTGGLGFLIYALGEIEQDGIRAPISYLSLVASVVLLVAFALRERRFASPLLPFALLKRPLVVGNVLLVASALVGSGTYYFASLYLQQVRGYSAMRTGFAVAPWAATIALCAILASRTNARFGGRRIAAGGFFFLSLGALLFALTDSVTASYLSLLPGFLIIGVGSGLSGVTNTIAAMAGVPRDQQGVAAGLTNSSQRLGSAIGLAILASVATSRIDAVRSAGGSPSSALASGYHLGLIVAAAVGAVAVLGALVLSPRRNVAPATSAQRSDSAATTTTERALAPDTR